MIFGIKVFAKLFSKSGFLKKNKKRTQKESAFFIYGLDLPHCAAVLPFAV